MTVYTGLTIVISSTLYDGFRKLSSNFYRKMTLRKNVRDYNRKNKYRNNYKLGTSKFEYKSYILCRQLKRAGQLGDKMRDLCIGYTALTYLLFSS